MSKENIIKIIFIILIIISLFILILNNLSKSKKKEFVLNNEMPVAFKTPNPYIKIDKKEIKTQNKIPSVVSDKTIYLTFDDGPSHLTNTILDILKEEDVPATFFVIGTHIDEYKDVVRRAYNDGHTIAIHTFTHNYKQIYETEENYLDDLNKINNKIYELTGHHSHIFRFPGGSSNLVSKKYNKGIITRLSETLTKNNYYYFDWNIDSGDASGKLSSEKIYENSTKFLHSGTNIILMHDAEAKKTTVEALPNIIKYAKENGYTFSRITKDTMPIKHRINN